MTAVAPIYAPSENALFEYLIGLGDDALVLGQRVSEWLGHAPEMELDIASSNLSLDLIGQAQLWLNYAGEVEGAGRDADALAFTRDVMRFRNHLLVEQPNRDWGVTMVRQFLFSAWQHPLYDALAASSDSRISEIAAKAVKEVAYHKRFAAEWVVRLGDGTEESHARAQAGVEFLWRYTGELFEPLSGDALLVTDGIAADAASLKSAWQSSVDEIFKMAGLKQPETLQLITGRENGHHTEHLGHLLSEMQFLQRAYPGAEW